MYIKANSGIVVTTIRTYVFCADHNYDLKNSIEKNKFSLFF